MPLLEFDGLRLSGEIDMASAPGVETRLRRHLDGGGEPLVDLEGVSFVDLSGCRALVEAADDLAPGRQLVLDAAPRGLWRIMDVFGWADHPRIVLRIREAAE